MDAIDCMMTRRTCRKYQTLPVEWEKIGYILNAGRSAPSAGNLQNYKFVIVMDKDKRELLAELSSQQYWMINAPVHIIVCGDVSKEQRDFEEKGALYTVQDCSAVIENMLLAAHAQGLGTCWVGSFSEDDIRMNFGMSDSVRPLGIVTIGYPSGPPEIPPKKPLHTLTYFEKYGNKVKTMHEMTGQYSDMVTAGLQKIKKIVTGK